MWDSALAEFSRLVRCLCSMCAKQPTSAWAMVMSTIPCNKATLPSMEPSRTTPVSQFLEGFGVPGVCLCWKRADQGKVMAKPVLELAAPLAPIQRGGSLGQGTLLHKCLQYLALAKSLTLHAKILGGVITPWNGGSLHLFGNQRLFIQLFP